MCEIIGGLTWPFNSKGHGGFILLGNAGMVLLLLGCTHLCLTPCHSTPLVLNSESWRAKI